MSMTSFELRAKAAAMRDQADIETDATVASAFRSMAASYDTIAARREVGGVQRQTAALPEAEPIFTRRLQVKSVSEADEP